MRALIQRTSEAKVIVDGKIVGEIGSGLLILLGVKQDDTEQNADKLVEKIINLRLFENKKGHFETSLLEEKKGVLIVSQFTLYGSTKKGRRPDFIESAKPDHAKKLYDYFVNKVRKTGLKTETGIFGAMMDVHLVNSGPVTFMLET